MKTIYKPEQFKEMRKKLGYGAADVARRINAPLERVKEWEAGLATPENEDLAKLQALFQQAQVCCQDVQTLSLTEMEMHQKSLDQMQATVI